MRPILLVFLVACALVLTAFAPVAVASSATGRFSYLEELTNGDLHQFLAENNVPLSGDEDRAELLEKAATVEAAKEKAEVAAIASGGSPTGAGRRIEVKYCVG